MLGYPTLTPNSSNVPSVAAAITHSTPHLTNASTLTSVAPNYTTKLCHHLPNLRAISSTSTNPVVSPSCLRASTTRISTQTLPISNPTISHRANHKVPTAPSLHHGNNKLSALSFGQPSLPIHPPTTAVTHPLRPQSTHLRPFCPTNPQQPQHNPNHRQPPIPSQRPSTNLSKTINHRFDLHLIQTNVHHQMDPPTTIHARHPMPLPLSETTVDASAIMHVTVPTLSNLRKTIMPPTHNHPTMKTQLSSKSTTCLLCN